jgi:transcriptional regulator with XRE-family HTH domain
MPTFYEEFGRRMARRRYILRLKQHEVGAAIGTQRSHVSALEHGRQHMMHLAQLQALAQVLRTSSDYLLQLVDDDPGIVPPRPCPAEEATAVESAPPLPATPILERTVADGEYSMP